MRDYLQRAAIRTPNRIRVKKRPHRKAGSGSSWSGRRDSNPRIQAWEAWALPLGDARMLLNYTLLVPIRSTQKVNPQSRNVTPPAAVQTRGRLDVRRLREAGAQRADEPGAVYDPLPLVKEPVSSDVGNVGNDVGNANSKAVTTAERVLRLVAGNPKISAQSIAVGLGMSKRHIERVMAGLRDEGILIREQTPREPSPWHAGRAA